MSTILIDRRTAALLGELAARPAAPSASRRQRWERQRRRPTGAGGGRRDTPGERGGRHFSAAGRGHRAYSAPVRADAARAPAVPTRPGVPPRVPSADRDGARGHVASCGAAGAAFVAPDPPRSRRRAAPAPRRADRDVQRGPRHVDGSRGPLGTGGYDDGPAGRHGLVHRRAHRSERRSAQDGDRPDGGQRARHSAAPGRANAPAAVAERDRSSPLRRCRVKSPHRHAGMRLAPDLGCAYCPDTTSSSYKDVSRPQVVAQVVPGFPGLPTATSTGRFRTGRRVSSLGGRRALSLLLPRGQSGRRQP